MIRGPNALNSPDRRIRRTHSKLRMPVLSSARRVSEELQAWNFGKSEILQFPWLRIEETSTPETQLANAMEEL